MLLALIILTVFITRDSLCTKCNSLKNVTVTVRTDRGGLYDTMVNGCIERVAFEDVIHQAYVKNQTIKRLGRDSVRNLKHLHSIQFYRCQIETVDPGAFRNVPNLRSVQIVSNEIKRISEGIFQLIPNLEIVKANRNKIDTIEDGAFYNVTTLKKIYLSHNLLKTWSRGWFVSTVNLQMMDFRFNKIKTLPREAFNGLSKLKEIYFDYNELEVIEEEALKGIKNLNYLGLRYNKLKSIDYKVFPNTVTIKSLTIDANYLNFLSEQVMDRIEVKELILEGNPWKCPCFNDILLWLYRINATVKNSGFCAKGDIPVCSFPSNELKTCTETIDEEVTTTYFQVLRNIRPPLDTYCARLE